MTDIRSIRLGGLCRRTPHLSALAVGAGVLLQLGGCGATLGDLTTASVTNYQAANLFAPAGYTISNNSDGSIHVTAAGSPGTPSDRLEKIALAAAADYGAGQHQKTFTSTPAQTSFKCGKTKMSDKGQQVAIKPNDLRVVAIDVTYGRDGIVPAARNTRETADALKAQLATETVPPDVQAAATQEVSQQCGRPL